MKTVLEIVKELIAAMQLRWAAEDVHLAEIDSRLQRIEHAVAEHDPTPSQTIVDALTTQVQQVTAGLKQSTGVLTDAITKETQTP